MLYKLKRLRVIEKAKKLAWQSRLFTVPKKDSQEGRLILDLSILNSYIKCPYFKMLTIKEVKTLLPKGFWTVSIDFKDGFWHLPIARTKRPFLGFRWKNQNWQFRAMPFGLNVAPRTFTKVVAHVVKIMAEAGIWCLPYLDDLLIIAPSQEECQRMASSAVEILSSLGWILNLKKSRLTPSQRFEWLGVQFDLSSHTAASPLEKLKSLQELLREAISAEHTSLRKVMRLQGLANWIGQHDRLVRLLLPRTRRIIRSFRSFHLDSPIALSNAQRLSLCRWITGIPIPQALGSPSPHFRIHSDAYPGGWGFEVNGIQYAGTFDASMSYHINVKELLTIWFSLLTISKKGAVIQLLCDNTSAIASVRRGSSLNPHLAALTELIWRRAVSLEWTISISFIRGSFNVIADQLSRGTAISTEWSLAPQDFQIILKLNPLLQVDVFATRLNNKLPIFISPCMDSKAQAVDALSTSWERWDHLYMFPPTNMISRALAKLDTTSFKSAVLVTPETPTRPWYMSLCLRETRSVPLEVTLQQTVVGKMVHKAPPSKLRVWLL